MIVLWVVPLLFATCSLILLALLLKNNSLKFELSLAEARNDALHESWLNTQKDYESLVNQHNKFRDISVNRLAGLEAKLLEFDSAERDKLVSRTEELELEL